MIEHTGTHIRIVSLVENPGENIMRTAIEHEVVEQQIDHINACSGYKMGLFTHAII